MVRQGERGKIQVIRKVVCQVMDVMSQATRKEIYLNQ